MKKFSFCEAPPRNIEVVGGCFLRGPSYYEASSLEKKKKCSSKTLLFQTKMVKFFTTMGVAQLAVICSIIFKGIFLRIFEDVRQIYYYKILVRCDISIYTTCIRSRIVCLMAGMGPEYNLIIADLIVASILKSQTTSNKKNTRVDIFESESHFRILLKRLKKICVTHF